MVMMNGADIEKGKLVPAVDDLSAPLLMCTKDASRCRRKRSRKSKQNLKQERNFEGSVINSVFCTLVVAMGTVSFGFSLGYSSPTQGEMIRDMKLSISQFSLFSSLINFGAMIGAISSGRIADKLGRKGALLVASAPHLLGWMVIIFSQANFVLYCARFLLGFGAGVISFTVPVYIAETAPMHLRGGFGAVHQLAVTIGVLLAYSIGLVLSWRTLAATGIIPVVILLLGLCFIPESPRWLAKVGYDDKLAASLQFLRGQKNDVSAELAEIKDAVAESCKLQFSPNLLDLCKRSLFRPLLVGIGLQVLQQFSGINAVMFYANSIFNSVGFSAAGLASISLAALQVLMAGVASVLMDYAGRRLLLMVSAGGMAASCFLVGFSFYLQDNLSPLSHVHTFVSILALTSLLVYITAFSLGMGPIPWIVMSEVFPVHVKGLAGSLATLINWSSAWVVTMTFNFLLGWSSTGSFSIFFGICAFTVVFAALFLPETQGKTLEEIEASFK